MKVVILVSTEPATCLDKKNAWDLVLRIRMFSGLLDPEPDPLVRGMYLDPDPSIIK
jgi:hypothetical protein